MIKCQHILKFTIKYAIFIFYKILPLGLFQRDLNKILLRKNFLIIQNKVKKKI